MNMKINRKEEYLVDILMTNKEIITLPAKKGMEKEIIDDLIDNFEQVNKILNMTFYTNVERNFLNLTMNFKENVKRYHFGEILSLQEYYKIFFANKGLIEQIEDNDDYRRGGVCHKETGIISPFYTNDQVLNVTNNCKLLTK